MFNNNTRWIVKLPYRGHSESFTTIIGGVEIVAYVNIPLEDYLADNEGLMVVSNEELDRLNVEYENTLVSKVLIPTDKEYFWDKLECLPPCKWTNFSGGEYFHMSERLRGNLTEWNLRVGNDYYCFTHHDTLSHDKILKMIRELN